MEKVANNIVDRIVKTMNADNSDKIESFIEKSERQLRRKIREYSLKIENIKEDANEKLEDLQESYNEALLTVDVDSLTTASSREMYLSEYIQRLENNRKEIEKLNNNVEVRVAEYEKAIDTYNNVLKAWGLETK